MRRAVVIVLLSIGCAPEPPAPVAPVAAAPAPPKPLVCPVKVGKDAAAVEDLAVEVTSGTLGRARESVEVCARAFSGCMHLEGYGGGSTVAGKATITIQIAKEGTVEDATAEATIGTPIHWQNCVENIARNLPFDAPTAPSVVKVTFVVPAWGCNPGDPICY